MGRLVKRRVVEEVYEVPVEEDEFDAADEAENEDDEGDSGIGEAPAIAPKQKAPRSRSSR